MLYEYCVKHNIAYRFPDDRLFLEAIQEWKNWQQSVHHSVPPSSISSIYIEDIETGNYTQVYPIIKNLTDAEILLFKLQHTIIRTQI